MNQKQALAKLAKILGSKMAWRINEKALDAEGREAARAEVRRLNEEKQQAEEALAARRAELLQDPAYQALKARHDALKKSAEQAAGRAYHQRITVGRRTDLFFHIEVEGDNWDDVVSKLTSQHKA